MEPGKLRHRVIVQTATETRDTSGEPIRAWADTATVWASISPISGREMLAAGQVVAEGTVRIRLRYRALTEAQRLKWGDHVYDIIQINNWNELNRDLEVMAKEAL